jgi:hypothetical protein
MTDFRALCEELLAAIEDSAFFRTNDALRFCKAVLNARTALADEDSAFLHTNNALRFFKAVPSAHAGRHPKPNPPSLKEQALAALHGIHDQGPTPEQVVTIRRALEQL